MHQASAGFAVEDREGLMSALIQAATPGGLQRLREPNNVDQSFTRNTNFGEQHWLMFEHLANDHRKFPTIQWAPRKYQKWVDEHEVQLKPSKREQLKNLIYRIPGGYKFVAFWRRMNGH